MPWSKRNRVRVINVDSRQLLRSTIYDTNVREPELIVRGLGIPPVSDEGESFEHDESVRRQRLLVGLMPIIQSQCTWAATAMVFESFDYDVDPEDEEVVRVAAIYTTVISGSVIGILSTLLDQGILEFASANE